MDFFKNLLKTSSAPTYSALQPSQSAVNPMAILPKPTYSALQPQQAGPIASKVAAAPIAAATAMAAKPARAVVPAQPSSNPYGISIATSGPNAGIDPYTLGRQSPAASPYQAPSATQINTNPQGVALDQYGEALLPGGIPSNPSLSINPIGANGAIPSSRIGTASYEDIFNTNNTLQSLQRKIFENTIRSQGEIDAQGRLNSATSDQLAAQKQLQDEIDRLASTSGLTRDQAGSFIGETQRVAQNTLANIALRRQAEAATLSALTGQRESQLAAFNALYGMNKPVSLSEGQSLYNPVTGQVTASGPKKATDDLLSVTEAQALGVPYGTKKSEAYGISPQDAKPLSGEASKLLSIADTIQPEIATLKNAFTDNYRSSLVGIVTGTNRELVKLVDQVADKVGRLRSGGAINSDEASRFKKQIASFMDIPFGSSDSAIKALDGILAEAESVKNGITGGKSASYGGSTGGQVVQTKAGPINVNW